EALRRQLLREAAFVDPKTELAVRENPADGRPHGFSVLALLDDLHQRDAGGWTGNVGNGRGGVEAERAFIPPEGVEHRLTNLDPQRAAEGLLGYQPLSDDHFAERDPRLTLGRVSANELLLAEKSEVHQELSEVLAGLIRVRLDDETVLEEDPFL